MEPKKVEIDGKKALEILGLLFNMRPCFESPAHHFNAYSSQGCFELLSQYIQGQIKKEQEAVETKSETE